MPCITSASVYTPNNGDNEIEYLLRPDLVKCQSIAGQLTSATQIHQSSHQTFRVSLTREYILPSTKTEAIASRIQVKANNSPARF